MQLKVSYSFQPEVIQYEQTHTQTGTETHRATFPVNKIQMKKPALLILASSLTQWKKALLPVKINK